MRMARRFARSRLPLRAGSRTGGNDSTPVATHAKASAGQKLTPPRSAAGKTTKNTSDGTTTQRIDHESEATSFVSFVSRYSQMAARIDDSGREMRIAPISEDRRASSLATAMIAPDKSALNSRYTRQA